MCMCKYYIVFFVCYLYVTYVCKQPPWKSLAMMFWEMLLYEPPFSKVRCCLSSSKRNHHFFSGGKDFLDIYAN